MLAVADPVLDGSAWCWDSQEVVVVQQSYEEYVAEQQAHVEANWAANGWCGDLAHLRDGCPETVRCDRHAGHSASHRGHRGAGWEGAWDWEDGGRPRQEWGVTEYVLFGSGMVLTLALVEWLL